MIFSVLLLEKSVSTTADKLNMTQPAVSQALRKLRGLFGDELFVRTTSGMQPTAYALEIAQPINVALSTLEKALHVEQSFDPRTSERTFRLAMTDIGEIYFVPSLIKTLAQEAPDIKISTVRNHEGFLKEDMRSGRVDIAMGHIPNLGSEFLHHPLFKQQYVCLYRKGHPILRQRISLTQYQSCGHIEVTSANTGHGEIGQWLSKKGIQRRVQLHVPHFVAVAHILQESDLIATVPEKLAQQCVKPFNLHLSPLPIDSPKIDINLFWHAKYNREPANSWLRQSLINRFADNAR